ncbi:MAG TPA: ABC transporter substrate-binding protein [Stellaceae bacterium]|jgi:sulfonate transport system substrate-binding protein|nr:ABC transporter substrate-binding protein [Stellaceae bacterium]
MSVRVVARSALIALAFSLGAAAAAETPPAVVHFGAVGSGYGQQVGTQLISIAHIKGFVQEAVGETTKLDWNYFTGTGPAINEALANGQLDFAQYGSLPSIIARANGLPTKIILSGGGTNIYAAVRTGLPIQSIKDLKGYSVTLQKATILHWSLLEALKANGLSENDVTILDLKQADQMAALAAGSADASFGTVSLLQLRDQGLVRIIYTSQHDNPRATGPSSFVVTEAFAVKYPETTQKIVGAFVKAAQWVSQPENREEALQIWAKSGVPLAALRDEYAGETLHDRLDPRLDDFFRGQYQDGIDFAKREKLIRKDVDLAQWIDTKYQDAAFASLNLTQSWPARSKDGTVASN